MRGLFINNKKAKDSIYESGYMVYQCLLVSGKYSLEYIEIDSDNRNVPTGFDFYFFNYHPATMSWMETSRLKKELGFCITMVLEVAPNDPFVLCPSRDFDVYCVLDPTVKINNKKVYTFPRPLEKIDFDLPIVENEIPVIGTFGFATKGKGFQHVVEAVNNEFDQAIVKINIPYGDFVPDSEKYAAFLGEICRKKAKPGIDVIVSHDFMDKIELIKWCASNSLNCFLYDRDMPGLAATTDQAIVSGKPLAISNNNTFRHIITYLPPYPTYSLKDSLKFSGSIVKKIQEEWSPENFRKKFETVLVDQTSTLNKSSVSKNALYLLPLKKKSLFNFIENRFKKYKRKLKKISLSLLTKNNDSKHAKAII